MPVAYPLEKYLFTDADFDNMNWHDCPIHSFCFNDDYELSLDIDYIFEWVQPKKGSKYYKFWITPCTLVFENVRQVEIELEGQQPIIDFIQRENPQATIAAEYLGREFEYDWDMVMINGEMTFKSAGFKQYVRQPPILIREQKLELEVRGGISFDRISFLEKNQEPGIKS
ncbi:hypothetical protein [Mucilaginibacter ginsenosidivorax]|uniref:hypothetical protein n=1 Tax=Mucilaginibacter ginsenosidivorax TaxID=862126 RepID=UPI001864581B|nr:hypothetical protein [Mucilaginibacter ginsenosidivorax]